jgi:hypothetical protein
MNDLLVRLFDPKFVYIQSHQSVESRPEFVDLVSNFTDKNFEQKGPWEL